MDVETKRRMRWWSKESLVGREENIELRLGFGCALQPLWELARTRKAVFTSTSAFTSRYFDLPRSQ